MRIKLWNSGVKQQTTVKTVLFLTAIFLAGMLGMGSVQAYASETVSASTQTFAATEEDDPEAELVRTDAVTEEENKSSVQATAAKNSGDAAVMASGSSDTDSLTIKAYGVDVSKYQGVIDWESVKKAGVSFAIIRVGYRGYSGGAITQDDYAITNIEGALEAGLDVGVYFFSTALNKQEAVEEAQFVVSVIEDYDITYPVVYDCEGYDNSSYRNYGLSNEVRTENAVAFLNYVEAAGYQGMMYGSVNALKNDTYWEASTLEQYYDMWIAQYYYYTSANQYPSYSAIVKSGRQTSYPSVYRIWQFTSQGKVNGISGYVDLNIEYAVDDYIMDTEVVKETDDLATGTDVEASEEYTTGWVKDSGGNTYYYDNGVMITGFYEIGGYTYYFASTGIMKTGLCKISGNLYYFTGKGVMWTGWVTLDDGYSESATYYFSSDGTALTGGWKTIGSYTYFFNASGRLHYGWRTDSNGKYYCSTVTGVLQTGLKTVNGKTYFFDTDGSVQYGWITTASGNKYYCDPSTGVMQTGWKTISGKKYFFNTSGRLHYGWRTASDGNKYYCDPTTGVMQTGWKTINGKKYFFNTSGRLHYGWRTASDGNKYYCDPSTGVMQTGWKTISGKRYFFNTSGRLHYGWRTASDGNKYYCDPSTGVMQTGWVTISGKTYFFNTSGRLHYGWRTDSNGDKYYCDPKTGVMQMGWVTIGGKQYYFYEDGRLKK